ncbi:YkvA family protein [Halomonas sp. G15]
MSPVDLMPDMLPGGFVDDLAVVMSVLKMLDSYVTPEMRRRARK